MNVTPGEPIPPGFEDEIEREAQIQSSIDQYKGNALIGIEYTVELHEDDRHEPGYLCLLCDKRGDPRTIINHWCSFNHRMKYLERHYPSAVRECQPVKYKPNSHNIMILIVQSLAEAIEDHYGRLKVTVMNADEFRKRKTVITEEIVQKFHYDEKNGPNFLNAIDRTLWEQKGTFKKKDDPTIKANKRLNTSPGAGGNRKTSPSNNRDGLDEISSESDSQETIKKPKMTKTQEPAFTHKQRNPPPAAISEEPEKKLPTPKELSLQASHIAQERYKWEKYRCMLEIQLKQMGKIQSDFEKAPEKHPHYPEEWKKFWNRRYKELQAEKKVDPNKYDYKPEWIVFWTKRMKELFNAEVEKKKKEIKIKLGLPEDAEEKVDQLKEKYKVPVNRLGTANRTNSRANAAADVIDISDDDSPRHTRYSRSRRTRSRSRSRSPRHGRQRDYRRSRTHSRSLSPFSEDEFGVSSPAAGKHHLHKKHHNPIRPYETLAPDYYSYGRGQPRYPPTGSAIPHYPPSSSHHYRILDSSKIPKYEESDSRSTKDSKEDPKDTEPEGPLTVVAVLRLLTALEEHLGSLGPKVVDLLGKALALEKVKGNSSDDLLTNEDHCVFFETIKEKLKGLLIADVIEDQQKVRAVKKAVKNIAAIIHQVTTKAPIQETAKGKDEANTDASSSTTKKTSTNASLGPNLKDLPFDRQTVATKMAAALVMQGREDVSTNDMDKLIYMFILMVKLSKTKRDEDGKTLYCNDILPSLGIARKPPPAGVSLAVLPSLMNELLESDEVSALVQEVEDEIDTNFNEKESKNDSNGNMLESLTDSDLQTLLQNFKHLSSEEQHHLIAHLKKLESADPSRVEKLRKFVNISDLTGPPKESSSSKSNKTSDSTPTKSASSRSRTRFDDSPPSASRRVRNAAPPGTEDDDVRKRVNPNKFSLDDDEDDDYNFDEVFKAASSNVNRLSEEHARQAEKNTKSPIIPVSSSPNALTFNPAGLKSSLNDTHNLIANLMGSLQQSNSSSIGPTNKSITSANAAAPKPVPPIEQVEPQMLPQQQQANQMAFYQQQQQAAYPGPYNQMNPAAQTNYYNSMSGGGGGGGGGGGYNQNPYDSYSQWGQANTQQMAPQNMQQFSGMSGFGMPPQQMGYNMYGQGHN